MPIKTRCPGAQQDAQTSNKIIVNVSENLNCSIKKVVRPRVKCSIKLRSKSSSVCRLKKEEIDSGSLLLLASFRFCNFYPSHNLSRKCPLSDSDIQNSSEDLDSAPRVINVSKSLLFKMKYKLLGLYLAEQTKGTILQTTFFHPQQNNQQNHATNFKNIPKNSRKITFTKC